MSLVYLRICLKPDPRLDLRPNVLAEMLLYSTKRAFVAQHQRGIARRQCVSEDTHGIRLRLKRQRPVIGRTLRHQMTRLLSKCSTGLRDAGYDTDVA